MAEPDYRFSLANERTFLAWVRTALGMLAGALFLLHGVAFSAGSVLLGLLLCVGCGVAILGGYARYRATDRAMRAGDPLPEGRSVRVIAGVVLLAVVLVTLAALPDLGNALDSLFS